MADQSVSEIIKSITDDVKVLVKDEVELAKAELIPSAKNAGIGAGLFGAAGYFGINALTLLYIAAALGLVALGVSAWLAFVIVAAVLLLIAGICALIGRGLVKKVKGPDKTVAEAKESVAAIKGAVVHANAAAKAPRIEGTVEGRPVAARALR